MTLTITTHRISASWYGATIRTERGIMGTHFADSWYRAFMLAALDCMERGLIKSF